jgi:FkbM family methyltransferase
MLKIDKTLKRLKEKTSIANIKEKVRKRIKKAFDLEEKNINQEPFSFLRGIMEGLLLSASSEIKIVPIGANDGKTNDPIYEFLMSNKNYTKALLVEPQDEIIPFLEKNYQEHPKIEIFNGAIALGDELILFRIKPNLWESFNPSYLKEAPRYRVASGITSSSKDRVLSAVKRSLEGDLSPEEAVEKVKVPCKQLKNLLKEYSFGQHIDILQVDVEGADDEVIYSCNIEEIRPLIINYEYVHLNIKRDMALEKYLINNDYKVFRSNNMDKIAILQKKKNKL